MALRRRLFLKMSLLLVAVALLVMTAGVLWLRYSSTSAIVHSPASPESPSDVAPPSELAVRVASLNAWLIPFGTDDLDERLERMGPAIDALEPDIVCLQEVWFGAAFESLVEALEHRLPNTARSGGGLAVLSRWPVREAVFEEFPASTAPGFIEWLARKGFLVTVLETPAGPLRVVNSHLAFDHSADNRGNSVQLPILLDALAAHTDLPLVLCADLNIRSADEGAPSAGFLSLLDAGLEDAADVGPDGQPAEREGTRVGWPREGRRARWDPDYVMFRSGDAETLEVTAFRQVLDTVETALSDHNLQLADILLESTN